MLTSAAAVHDYATVYYPNHEVSLKNLQGVVVHGYWSATDTDAHQFCVLMSYPEGADPDALRQSYRQHPEAAAGMPGFDPSVVRSVSVTLLAPAASSPLQ